jgi:hypothetical protein
VRRTAGPGFDIVVEALSARTTSGRGVGGRPCEVTIDLQPAAAYRLLSDPVLMADFAEEFYRAGWVRGASCSSASIPHDTMSSSTSPEPRPRS